MKKKIRKVLSDRVPYYLTDEALNDRKLNTTDKNVLAALGLCSDGNVVDKDGNIEFIPYTVSEKVENSLNHIFHRDGIVEKKRDAILDSLRKLDLLGYIVYKAGHRPKNGWRKSTYATFRLLKGLRLLNREEIITNASESEDCEKKAKLYENSNNVINASKSDDCGKKAKLHYKTLSIEPSDSITVINREKDKKKDIERKSEKETDVPSADKLAETCETETINKQTANDMTASEADDNNNVQEDVNSICIDSDDSTETISKDELDRTAITYAVLRRAGWRSWKQWNDDVQWLRQQYNAVYRKGEQWTERVIDRLNTIANTIVKDKYTDEFAQRVFNDKQAQAFENIERMFVERKLQRRMMNQKDNEYYQRISWPFSDCLQQLILSAITNRLTAAVWGLRDEYEMA